MRTILILVTLLLGATAATSTVMQRAREQEALARARDLTGGDPQRGKALARQLGCVACHVMPGVRGPQSRVGPPLKDFAKGKFVGGAADNTPENVIRFIRDPRAIAPKSAMPNVGVREAEARDLAAYLYALR